MKPKLILIGGEAWTGKSTCAEILFKRLNNSAWLDGDDVWRVKPWSLDDPRLRDKEANPCFLVLAATRALVDTVKIETANRKPEESVDEMLSVLQSARRSNKQSPDY